MSLGDFSGQAKRLITAGSLIAADIDQTLLVKGAERERQHFLESVAPELLRAASLGANLAFLTANSMHELSSRFLQWLIAQISHIGRWEVLDRFHFFSNSAGVYAHFSLSDKALKSLLSEAGSAAALNKVLGAITVPDAQKKLAIRPRFIDAGYIERSMIPEDEAEAISEILERIGQEYITDLVAKRSTYGKTYDISQVSDNSKLRIPKSELRIIAYGSDSHPRRATVQITLKPILSFRHAHKPFHKFGNDLRVALTEKIQAKLDAQGLGHYVARPGGLSSIDVTLEKLDKAYALEFIIDRLNLAGCSRRGQKFGSNAIYIGDEVIAGGGNDYAVTRIPGLLVFAVNPDQRLIPFLSHVFVPSAILVGPDASGEILSQFNKCAVKVLSEFDRQGELKGRCETALHALKEELFVTRIRENISNLRDTDRTSVEDWQTLHAFVTLMVRKDPAAGQWLSILISELDAIMAQLATGKASTEPASTTGGTRG